MRNIVNVRVLDFYLRETLGFLSWTEVPQLPCVASLNNVEPIGLDMCILVMV